MASFFSVCVSFLLSYGLPLSPFDSTSSLRKAWGPPRCALSCNASTELGGGGGTKACVGRRSHLAPTTSALGPAATSSPSPITGAEAHYLRGGGTHSRGALPTRYGTGCGPYGQMPPVPAPAPRPCPSRHVASARFCVCGKVQAFASGGAPLAPTSGKLLASRGERRRQIPSAVVRRRRRRTP